jgi:CubicO group peptidase (beta-lactamase class C family)
VVALATGCARDNAADPQSPASAPATTTSHAPAAAAPEKPAAPEFAAVSKLITDAIAADRIPGAVVLAGHAGKVAFHRAYGFRKLDGEPGLDGSPAPSEPMTDDTVFDIA